MYTEEMNTPDPPPGLRERTRRVVQAEISHLAMTLFLQQGFHETTMDQIAQAAGISRRSLFRYFSSKEDFFVQDFETVAEQLETALKARPPEEAPWEALNATFLTLLNSPLYSPQRTIEIARLILDTPALRAVHLEKHWRWQERLVPVMQARMGKADPRFPDPRAVAVVAAALSCLLASIELWVRKEGQVDALQLYRDMVDQVRK